MLHEGSKWAMKRATLRIALESGTRSFNPGIEENAAERNRWKIVMLSNSLQRFARHDIGVACE
jgi:hypothetical protein